MAVYLRILPVRRSGSITAFAQVEKGAQIAAGAVVAAGTTVPAGELWGGNPARCLRPLKPEEASFIPKSAQMYAQLGAEHAADVSKAP